MQFLDNASGHVVESIEDELIVVEELIKSSHKFKLFYKKERVGRLGIILWLKDPELHPEIRMKNHISQMAGVNYPVIYIRDYPLSPNEDCVAAHEIMHLILAEEEKSLGLYSKARSPDQEFGQTLNSMFEDPIIDRFLRDAYNFDILSEYEKDLKWMKELHEKCHIEPTDESGRLLFALRVFHQLFKFKIITDAGFLYNWSKFQEDLRKWYPNAFSTSEEIQLIVGKEEIEIKESRILAQKIIEKYNLEKIVSFDPSTLR